jgi:hypothetical protein
MPKFYVSYKNLSIITDEINSENAAGRMMLVIKKLNTNNLIYVDERGFRKRDAVDKFNIIKSFDKNTKKPIWYLKKK